MLVAAIVCRWRLEPVPQTDSTLRLGITLHPKGPLLRVTRRAQELADPAEAAREAPSRA